MAQLVVETTVVVARPTIFEDGNPLTDRVFEFNHTRKLLIQAVGFFDVLDIGSKRFGQIDCGEHLHRLLAMVPQFLFI